MIALNMRAKSLRGFLGLAGVLGMLGAACSSTPARVAAPPAPPAKKEVVEVKEPEPPPEPLVSADVAFEQKWEFVKLSLMDVRSDSDFMPEDEIVKKLPTAQRFEYQSVQRARKQLLATEERMNVSRRGIHKAGKAGVAQYRLTLVARRKAREAVLKAVAKADLSITQAMDKKPSAELGLALARLRTSRPEARYDDTSRTLAYGFTETSSDPATPEGRRAHGPGLDWKTCAVRADSSPDGNRGREGCKAVHQRAPRRRGMGQEASSAPSTGCDPEPGETGCACSGNLPERSRASRHEQWR
jgi:hypothetical protein